MKNKQISIIGGHGLMGSLFSRLLGSLGHNINKIGKNNWNEAPEILKSSDLVIITVPIEQTENIIHKAVGFISEKCLLADFTSLKVDPLMAMLSSHNGPVIGLHPMFGPTISSTKSQVIINCPGRDQHAAQWLLDDLGTLGFTLKKMSAREHDTAMNFIQGIEHFVTFSLGTFLHHKNQHPSKLLEISSPIYLTKLLLLGRIFDQSPELYADIIMAHPERIQLIAEFADWLQKWVKEIQSHDKDNFIAEFVNASRWMGEFTAKAQKVSDHFLNVDITK